MSSIDADHVTVRGIPAAVVGPVLSGRTYRNLLYLVLAFPLSLLYWSLFGFGLVLGTLLSLVLVGIGVLILMVLIARGLATLERRLANALLSVSLEAPDDVAPGDGPAGAVRGYLDAASTWQGLGFLSLKGFLGLIGVALAYGLVQGVTLLSVVVNGPRTVSFGEVNGDPVRWTVETLPETALAMALGTSLVLVVLHLANGFGYVAERVALALLGNSVDG